MDEESKKNYNKFMKEKDKELLFGKNYENWMDKESYNHYHRFMENYNFDIVRLKIEEEKRNGNTNSNKQEEVLSTISGTTKDCGEVEQTNSKGVGCTCRDNVHKQQSEGCTCRTQS